MAKKKGVTGRFAKSAGAAAGVSVEAPPLREFNQGDLVLAKVKGWPAWPAQVVKMETQGKHNGKYYVSYFGPGRQIGWCLPAELFDFDAEQREAAIQKSLNKKIDKKFIAAVKEICGVQDERPGIMHKDSADEKGELPEDDAPRVCGLDAQEDDLMEGYLTSDVKHDTFDTQVVTLNQQDYSISFNDGNSEENVGDEDDADKDWSEKPEYNDSGLQTGEDSARRGQEQVASPDGVGGDGFKSSGTVQELDLETNGGTRRAFRNALKRINETAEKDAESNSEKPESKGPVLTYQYGRKKNRNKNNSADGSVVVNGAGTIAGQAIVDESAPLHVESSDVQMKIKLKVGRPSKDRQQATMGGRDSKSNVQASRKSNARERESKLEKGDGLISHEGSGKFAKDPSNNGYSKKGPYSKEEGESRERKSEDKKDVKRVASEADRLMRGPKKSGKTNLEEGKKHSIAPKQRDEHAKSSRDAFEKKVTTAFSGFHGGFKSKGDVKGDASLKRRRLADEGKEENAFVEGEKGDAGTSLNTDIDEIHLPLSKRLASEDKGLEGKQKHVSVGRSGLDGGNVERDSPRDGKSRERGTSLSPKADKDRMRKAALDGEAALPPSKRRNRAFAAMSACEAEAATASAAESREPPGNGGGNETVKTDGKEAGDTASPLKNATVTPDISESIDAGHKSLKVESGYDDAGGQERKENKKHVPLKEAQATNLPSKVRGVEEPSKVQTYQLEGRAKILKSKSWISGQNSGAHGSPGVTKASLEGETEKGKGHLTGSESGKLNTGTPGGTEAFASFAKLGFDDSIIKNAVSLANEKRNALKKEGDASASMKVLIAAAQAKQRARQYSTGGSGSSGFAELNKFTNSMVCSPSPSQRRGASGLTWPVQHGQVIVSDPHDRHAGWSSGVGQRSGAVSMEPEVYSEAIIARDTFVGMLETVSRTKDSIGRTTRQAMDCAKHGIPEQIVEIIVRKLENEPSFHRRVDYWFLLDSVTQVAQTQKVAAYLPIVQSSLPRILNAAAPPGAVARENRKQCLKVLNLWSKRKVMPESILRHFMTEIESHNDGDKGLPGGGGHRLLSRYGRGLDDPVRDMDGMLVDEYGSNASLNLPDGFSISSQLNEDEEDGSEGGDKKLENEFVGAIDSSRSAEDGEGSERHRTVLEDVDGELEMEDVSPTADSAIVDKKERERLLADHFAEEGRSNHGQPPLPLGPPPSVPSPPPLPSGPPPSSPPPPRSAPPPLSAPESLYSRTGIPMRPSSAHSQDGSSHQWSDWPLTPSAYSGHQGQGSLGLSQGGSRSNSYPSGSLSQLVMPLGSPLPPPPSQHSSPVFAQDSSSGSRLPPPPPLPSAYRPQRVWPESLASPAGDCDISPRLAKPGEDQVRQGVQEVSGGERVGELSSAHQDAGAAHIGGCRCYGPPEGFGSFQAISKNYTQEKVDDQLKTREKFQTSRLSPHHPRKRAVAAI